jgi:flagellar basal-body rod protein FlgG
MRFVRRVLTGLSLAACLVAIAGATFFFSRYQVQLRVTDRQGGDPALPELAGFDQSSTLWPPAALSDDSAVDQSTPSSENPAALAAIQEELRDASPEEHEIWYAELKQHSPQQIREILSLHRRIWPKPPSLTSEGLAPANAEAQVPKRLEEQVAFPAPRRTVEAGFIESSVTAIEAAERVIANNIANASTVGFKRSRPVFTEKSSRQGTDQAAVDQPGLPETATSAAWRGTSLTQTQVDHSQGRHRETKQPLDLAIQGDGYFQISDGNQILYTRSGTFSVNQSSQVVLVCGERRLLLKPGVALPVDTVQISISSGGIVSILQAGTSQLQPIGKIQLARFINPAGLAAQGDQLFAETSTSGKPVIAIAGDESIGKICQGYLEEANVDLETELAELRRLREQSRALRTASENLSAAPRPIEPGGAK